MKKELVRFMGVTRIEEYGGKLCMDSILNRKDALRFSRMVKGLRSEPDTTIIFSVEFDEKRKRGDLIFYSANQEDVLLERPDTGEHFAALKTSKIYVPTGMMSMFKNPMAPGYVLRCEVKVLGGEEES